MGKHKTDLLAGSHKLRDVVDVVRYKRDFAAAHPDYFPLDGLLIFCGPQGSGKTISAVQYCRKILQLYPKCIFVTNVDIDGLPEDVTVIEYNGIESLSNISNGEQGVLYLIDEIHLEFNSLESKSISIEEMIEFAQQRKQRKHIVGTSQVFMRLAKPLREQIKRVVLCSSILSIIQHNVEIDGTTAYEEDGKLKAQIMGHYYFFHTVDLYGCYDTYAKMRRYKDAWNNRSTAPAAYQYDINSNGQRKLPGHVRKRLNR